MFRGGVALANQRRDAIGDEARDVLVILHDHRANPFFSGARVRNARGPAITSIAGPLRRHDRVPARASDRPIHVVTPDVRVDVRTIACAKFEKRELRRERAAAAAAARGIRILEREA